MSVIKRDQTFLNKIRRGLKRDSSLPLTVVLKKGVSLAKGTLYARLALRSCDSVGPGARLSGELRVINRGSISIGSGFVVMGPFVPVELLTGAQGRLEIGDEVWANFGCVFSAKGLVRIGNGSQFGQHCIVTDSDTPEIDVPSAASEARPIEIGAMSG